MNLADKIIANREKERETKRISLDFEPGELDDCGIPTPEVETYDYLCARTFKIHPRLYQKNGMVKEIGRAIPYPQDLKNALWLVGLPSELLKKNGHVVYWRRMMQLLPALSEDLVQVSENVFWDKENGKLIRRQK